MKKQIFPCDYCKFQNNKIESVVEHFETKNLAAIGLNVGCVVKK
jgi:hypothetical protein